MTSIILLAIPGYFFSFLIGMRVNKSKVRNIQGDLEYEKDRAEHYSNAYFLIKSQVGPTKPKPPNGPGLLVAKKPVYLINEE